MVQMTPDAVDIKNKGNRDNPEHELLIALTSTNCHTEAGDQKKDLKLGGQKGLTEVDVIFGRETRKSRYANRRHGTTKHKIVAFQGEKGPERKHRTPQLTGKNRGRKGERRQTRPDESATGSL